MRTLALLTCLIATTSQAAMIQWQHGGGNRSSSGLSNPPPAEAHYVVLDDGQPIIDFMFPPIYTSPDPQVFVLDESNAADYGVDWSVLEGIYLDPWDYIFRPMFLGFSTNWRWPTAHTPIFTAIDRLEFQVDYYYSTLIGSAVRARYVLYGEGRIVPEPGVWAMLLAMLLVLYRVRH